MDDDVSTGQYLMRRLKARGVDAVFGMPGVHTLELYRGIAAERMRHVLVRHEQGAGFMADGYARATGRPGTCTLITGPGLTNALTAIGQAYSDSVPMLVLSSVNPMAHGGLGQGRLHEIADQQAVIAPLVGLSRTATDAAGVDGFLFEAWEMFAARRPRPAHLQIPVDALSAPSGGVTRQRGASRPLRVAAAEIERAARLLTGAARPMLVAGGGAIGAAGVLSRLAERLGAAVLTTVAGKGLLPDRHPLSLGATMPEAPAREMLRRADVVLALGTELAETDHWADRLDIPGMIVRVDLDPGKLHDPLPAELPLLGDAGHAAADILDSLGAGRATGWDGRAAEEVSAVRRAVDATAEATRAGFLSALRALREALPADAMVATDMTQLAYAANVAFPVDRPRSYFHPVGFGTLGYALPAAIGAKVAAPERPVVAVAGDGGFLFTLAELGTAVELGISLPIVLWDNNGLGQIRDDMIARQMPQIGVNPRNPDYLAVARAFGAEAVEVRGPRTLVAELREALQRPAPTLLRVLADSFP